MIKKQTNNCCGCRACESVCAKKAIDMVPDELGFEYPVADESKCNGCGRCEKVCQFAETYDRYDNFATPISAAFRLKDEKMLERSQSGGAFYAIASSVIAEEGVVYGAAFDPDFSVSHHRAETLSELDALRLSKYVQSELKGVHEQVRNDLKNGKIVLFSGTPCQVAGMKAAMPNRLQEKLLTIDIVCHGVPSPRIWGDYLKHLEDTRHSSLISACFRDKRFGWHGAVETYRFADGMEIHSKQFNHMYFTGLSTRDCCFSCPFTNTQRVGDISVGDFWGLPQDSPYEDGKGLSLVLINSDKGRAVFESNCLPEISEYADLKDCLQPQLLRPATPGANRSQFVADYSQKGIGYVLKRYGDYSRWYKLKKIIKRIIHSVLK